jgi:hydroxymethylbilane synthase
VKRKIVIGTRGSDLALWQANYTKKLLEEKGHECELRIIQTSGDKTQQWETSFDKIEGKGFFTKELEDALLDASIDLAVHSHKDLPTEMPGRLMVAGVSRREDPSELLIIRKESVDAKQKFSLRKNSTVGSSSSRRKSQLLSFRRDLKVNDIRGNVPTRVRKLREGAYDAILLAAAGIERLQLDLSDLHVEKIDPREFVPAPAQGVLAWQCREDDQLLLEAIDGISDLDARIITNIERDILALFHGGCHLPLGVYCESEPDENERLIFKLWVTYATSWDAPLLPFYFETADTDGFADMVVDHIRGLSPGSVFITRDLREHDYFKDTLSRLGFSVNGKSLIEFREIRIKELPKTEWVFFSSKHAVRYFFRQKPALGNVKFGCLGTGTSAELRAHGFRADFIGQSADVKLVGKQFGSRAGNTKVLFPVSRGSLQTIQAQMPKKENVINLEVYATLKHPIDLPDTPNILVFTSPSNVESFFEKNKLSGSPHVVAMGESTGKALERQGIKKYLLPQSFDDLGLVRAVLAKGLREPSNT